MPEAWETNPVPSDMSDIDPASIDTGAADAIAANFFERGGQPAVSYGIVAGGRLVHSAGFGARSAEGTAPDADTVFRIASMSKSFTASAVLLLRDTGALTLDDPVAKYVPELAGGEPVTIRNLLTMSAGFPTDDPWGDRQQGLSYEAFGALLAGGVSVNWAPGTRFEYSNLGYAVLGRVITAATGADYADFVRTRLLEPLGLTRTGFTAEEFGGVSGPAGSPVTAASGLAAGENLAQGYRRGPADWEPVPFEPHGAFAPMGGVFSSVRDLAGWVNGFASVFSPGASSGGHPLRAASRREMQLPQAVTAWRSPERLPGGEPGAPAYYGFGLFVDEDPALGRIVNHSGGYPGFGSNMRWHPATGIGVIALGNGTYCGMSQLTGLILRALVPSSPARHVALAPSRGPWPETVRAQEAVTGLLTSWDDSVADELFTENVAWDAPYPERRRDIDLVRERIGDFTPDDSRPAESDAPSQRRWWLTGPRGTVQVQIQLNPGRPPKVQSLAVAVPPEPGGALESALLAVVAWMNGGSPSWPASVTVAEGVDTGLLGRRLRMAAAWAGPVRPGAFRGGDGSAVVNVELLGDHATIGLALSVSPSTGALRSADVVLLADC